MPCATAGSWSSASLPPRRWPRSGRTRMKRGCRGCSATPAIVGSSSPSRATGRRGTLAIDRRRLPVDDGVGACAPESTSVAGCQFLAPTRRLCFLGRLLTRPSLSSRFKGTGSRFDANRPADAPVGAITAEQSLHPGSGVQILVLPTILHSHRHFFPPLVSQHSYQESPGAALASQTALSPMPSPAGNPQDPHPN